MGEGEGEDQTSAQVSVDDNRFGGSLPSITDKVRSVDASRFRSLSPDVWRARPAGPVTPRQKHTGQDSQAFAWRIPVQPAQGETEG